jgi:hypothetical protein
VPHDQIQLLLRVHRGTGCDSTSTAGRRHSTAAMLAVATIYTRDSEGF